MENSQWKSRKRMLGWLVAAFAALLLSSEPVNQLCSLPDSIRISEGGAAQFELGWPMTASIDQSQMVISGLSETLSDVTRVQLNGETEGEASVTFRLLGVLPIRTVAVAVDEARVVVPGGQSVGIALNTEGVLIVGMSDPNGTVPGPARLAGLRAGDVITSINGSSLKDTSQLSELVAPGNALKITVRRAGEELTFDVTPAQDSGGVYRLGMWVRDGTAGIGTLSFYDPDSGMYGALGHAITDADTGVLLPLDSGNLMESSISEIKAGKKGEPGELIGRFGTTSRVLGDITQNCSRGIYGNADGAFANSLFPDGVSVMSSGEVRPGKAQLLTTLDDTGIHAYDCEIVRMTDSPASERGFVLRITDPELLDKTGGIVQGMSGSPILQDGRLAGAVTHVFVSDPARGYGIFIENMLEQVA